MIVYLTLLKVKDLKYLIIYTLIGTIAKILKQTQKHNLKYCAYKI